MKIPFISWGGSHFNEASKKLLKDKDMADVKPETKDEKNQKSANWFSEISKGMFWLWSGDGTDPDKSKRHSLGAVIVCLFCFWLLQDNSPLWHSLYENKSWFVVFLILIIPLAVKFPKYASIAFGLSLVWVLIDSKGGFDKFKSQDHRKPTAIALELNKPQEIVCRANEWTDDFLVGKKLEWDLPDDVIYSVMVNGETSLEGLSGPKMESFRSFMQKE
jgi:hypothetical protein